MRTHVKKKIIGFCVLLILAVLVTAVNIWQKNKSKFHLRKYLTLI